MLFTLILIVHVLVLLVAAPVSAKLESVEEKKNLGWVGVGVGLTEALR